MLIGRDDVHHTAFNAEPESKLYDYKIGLDKIQNELIKFGLTRTQAKVFIYLGKYGSKTSPQVCAALKLPRTETYHILNVLLNRGIIVSEFSHPAKFSALPMKRAILTMVRSAQEKVNSLAKKEKELAKLWNEIPFFAVKTNEPEPEKFQMLQGTPRIHSKMKEMISSVKNECKLMCTAKDLSRFYYSDLIDMLDVSLPDTKLIVSPSTNIPNFIQKMNKTRIRILPKNCITHQSFFVKDIDEVLVFLRNANYPLRNVFAFWTDSKSLIDSMRQLFDYSWENSKSLLQTNAIISKHEKTKRKLIA